MICIPILPKSEKANNLRLLNYFGLSTIQPDIQLAVKNLRYENDMVHKLRPLKPFTTGPKLITLHK